MYEDWCVLCWWLGVLKLLAISTKIRQSLCQQTPTPEDASLQSMFTLHPLKIIRQTSQVESIGHQIRQSREGPVQLQVPSGLFTRRLASPHKCQSHPKQRRLRPRISTGTLQWFGRRIAFNYGKISIFWTRLCSRMRFIAPENLQLT